MDRSGAKYAQLTLIWLLDYLRHYAKIASKLTLVPGGRPHRQSPRRKKWPKRRLLAVKILNDHVETASAAWQAYRACDGRRTGFNLLFKGFEHLPASFGRPAVELLEELPMRANWA